MKVADHSIDVNAVVAGAGVIGRQATATSLLPQSPAYFVSFQDVDRWEILTTLRLSVCIRGGASRSKVTQVCTLLFQSIILSTQQLQTFVTFSSFQY